MNLLVEEWQKLAITTQMYLQNDQRLESFEKEMRQV